MILPIYAFGQKVLKQKTKLVTKDYPKLEDLVKNMWDTMYNAQGVGLAAPQIGLPIRMFIIDTIQLEDEKSEKSGIKQVFINAEILEETGDFWSYEEGCLSIPNIRGDVERNKEIKMRWMDENFEEHEETFTNINARVIQHEYDHVEGILFTEKLKPLKKKLIKKKLEKIKTGKVDADYRMKFTS